MSDVESKTGKKGGIFKRLKNRSGKIKRTFIALLIVAIGGILVGIWIGPALSSNIISRETVVEFGFEEVGQLVTQEWYGRLLEDSKKDRKIFNTISIPFTESRLIFSLDVEVLAGVDFTKIEYNTDLEKKVVDITVPHSAVYKSYEVPKSFVAYLDEESWFTNIDATEQQILKDSIVEKGKEQAIASGLLEKADKNAENIIKNMVRGNELTKDFEINFKFK